MSSGENFKGLGEPLNLVPAVRTDHKVILVQISGKERETWIMAEVPRQHGQLIHDRA